MDWSSLGRALTGRTLVVPTVEHILVSGWISEKTSRPGEGNVRSSVFGRMRLATEVSNAHNHTHTMRCSWKD